MAKARELAQQAQTPAPQIAKPDTNKQPDQPKLTPPKPAASQPVSLAPQEQIVLTHQTAPIAENKPAANNQQQQSSLSKRPPEKKAGGEEDKKSIFDRIKLNREPKTDNGGKSKQSLPKFDRHPQGHSHKRTQEVASTAEEAEDHKKQVKETPEEEAQRQARLDELLAKAKKVRCSDRRERSACTSPTAATRSVSSCTPKRSVRGSRSVCSERAATTSTPR